MILSLLPLLLVNYNVCCVIYNMYFHGLVFFSLKDSGFTKLCS